MSEGKKGQFKELLRIIDSIHRDKQIDKEVLFEDIETALLTAAKTHFGTSEGLVVSIDRETGEIKVNDGNGETINPSILGRIAAQTAKQVIIQRIRNAEQEVIFKKFEHKTGDMVSGIVTRFERGAVVINFGNIEGLLRRNEQLYGEYYKVGMQIKCYIKDVKRDNSKVEIILSRADNNLVKKLLEMEVPEISDRTITIHALARDPGSRTKLAVSSMDRKIDPVGACVGVRGSRIKNITEELNGEKIDVIPWDDSVEVLIMNSLKPAEINSITIYYDEKRARVVVDEEQLAKAIGKRGQNVKLTSVLTGFEIDIVTSTQEKEHINRILEEFQKLPGVDATLANRLYEVGYESFNDIFYKGIDAIKELECIDDETAEVIFTYLEQSFGSRENDEDNSS